MENDFDNAPIPVPDEPQKPSYPPLADGEILVGLDPASYRNCGWGVVKFDGNKAILLKKYTQVLERDQNDMGRLEDIYGEAQKIIDEFHPLMFCIERSMGGGLQFVRNNLSENVGVVKLCCHRSGVKVYETSPAHTKKVVTGAGRAKKKHVKANIVAAFGLPKAGPEHECDACAFALTALVDQGWRDYVIPVPCGNEKIKKKVRK